MNYPQIIELKTPELSGEKPEMVFANTLRLFETHLTWEMRMIANRKKDADDEMLGWEQSETNYHAMVKRDTVTLIERYWTNDQKVFLVVLTIPGNGNDFCLKFKAEEEADEIFAKLTAWWLNGTV